MYNNSKDNNVKIHIHTGQLCTALFALLTVPAENLVSATQDPTLTIREDVPSEVTHRTIVLCTQATRDQLKKQVATVTGGNNIIVLTPEGALGFIKERLPPVAA